MGEKFHINDDDFYIIGAPQIPITTEELDSYEGKATTRVRGVNLPTRGIVRHFCRCLDPEP